MLQVTITQPCIVDGEHKDIGDVVDVIDNDAMAIVGAGRGTVDKHKAADAQVKASKAKSKD